MEGTPARILIVEDDDGLARLLQKRLQQLGYEVQTFAHASDAVPTLRSGNIDLMILDYRLPEARTGLEFYEELKHAGHDIPAILITGFANEALIITALRAGVKDFVSKSVEFLDYLPEAVGRVLRQRQLERRLAETEARFETVFRRSPLGIALTRLSDGLFIDANEAFLRTVGYSRQELIGSTSAELRLLPESFDRSQMIAHVRATGSIRQQVLNSKTLRGHAIALELSAELIDFNGIECLLCLTQDITERRRAEERLRLQQRAIDAASEGILIADAQHADLPLVFVNRAFEQVTGYHASEVLGRNCRFLQGPDTDPHVVAELRAALVEGRPVTAEILNYRKDGEPFWNLLSITPVRDADGRITHFVGVQRDVTERKLFAEQLRQSQKMEAIGRLAGGVAHDFNNILTIMLGNTEIALEDLQEARDCRPLLQEVMQAGQRAAGLTRQLLAFSRRQVFEPRVLDLNVVVRDAERLLRRLIGEDIMLSTALEANLRPLLADPVQLEQILLNLTVNARDAMPRGGRLVLETRNIDLEPTHRLTDGKIRPGPYVLLAVSDTGHGMDEQTRSRIFEPFFTTKERGRGTGMGLSTVYGIVQQSQGYVWVESEVGEGTTFSIYLPAHTAGGAPGPRAAARPASQGGTETLLLVEDEAAVRFIAKRMLEGQGYRVLEASRGGEALEIAAQVAGPIDLLITDVIMPEMSGRQLAEQLLATRPQTRVLYVSGYTDNEISQHGVLAPNVAFLQKPFSNESLAAKVRQLLDAAN